MTADNPPRPGTKARLLYDALLTGEWVKARTLAGSGTLDMLSARYGWKLETKTGPGGGVRLVGGDNA